MNDTRARKRLVYFLCLLAYAALTAGATFALTAAGVTIPVPEGTIFSPLFHRAVVCALICLIVCCLVGCAVCRKHIAPRVQKLRKFYPFLHQLVRRDFKAKYKRSVLGILWTVLNPLLTMIVMTIVFSTLFRFDIEHFPVYLLSSQILFTFYSESTTMCMSSIMAGAHMIKKVDVPKYIFPFSKVLSSLVNFGLSLIALLLVMVFTKTQFQWTMLLMPIPLAYTFVFSLGIGLMLASLAVYFRDMNYLYTILLTLVTYLTPMFYPIEIIPAQYLALVKVNPMYHMVTYFRSLVLYGTIPGLWPNVVCALYAIIALLIGMAVFVRKQDTFILYI